MECSFPESTDFQEVIEPGEDASKDPDSWTLSFDGSSINERSGAGLILKSPDGFQIKQAITFKFAATNNQAEYEAILDGLRLARSLKVQKISIYSDSQIVVKQTSGEYIAKDPKLAQYQALVKSYLALIQYLR